MINSDFEYKDNKPYKTSLCRESLYDLLTKMDINKKYDPDNYSGVKIVLPDYN